MASIETRLPQPGQIARVRQLLCLVENAVPFERAGDSSLVRLTHRCHILETKGEGYRLQDAKRRRQSEATSYGVCAD